MIPIIIMSKTAKGCFDPSDCNRNIGEIFSNIGAICFGGAIGALSHFATRSVIIEGSSFLCNRIMSNHRIDISAVYKEGKLWFSEFQYIFRRLRLRKNANAKTIFLENARNDGGAKARVIHIGIPAHDHNIGAIPAPFKHLAFGDW